MQRSIVLVMLAASLAGCSAGEETQAAEAAFDIAVVDDGPRPVDLEVSGAWLHAPGAGNGSWHRVMDPGAAFNLSADGGEVGHSAAVPAGDYDRFRMVLREVRVGGRAATLAETGFELPIGMGLPADSVTRVTFTLAWADALFEAAQGPAFVPALRAVNVTQDGAPLVTLEARDIQTGATKRPVARIDAYDAKGLRFFQSDFVAESPVQRIIAVGPNLTFQASGSEAVEPGAALERFLWDFGDGSSGEGPTVEHAFPLGGGNHTVRLSVVDSVGVEDSLSLKIAIAPGTVQETQRVEGTARGVYPRNCASSSDGLGAASHAFTLAADGAPDGTPADLIRVRASVFALGNPHAQANIDMRLIDPEGEVAGSGTSSGTSEKAVADYEPGSAPGGDWTVEVKPCVAADVDYQVVLTGTWQAAEPEPGYARWLAGYDDGHEHAH